MLDSPGDFDLTLPSGTVTFLFTDIEGSTRLWQDFPTAMPAALARHHEILRHAIGSHDGYIFQIVGDSFHVAFDSALEGMNAALDAQRALCTASWGETGPVRVRMALHTDHAQVHADNYTSGEYVSGEYLVLARTERLLSAAHGGQILLSVSTAELVRAQLPPQLSLLDLGVHRVKDFQPQQIYQLITPELPSEFPLLKTLESLANNLPLQLTSFIGREKEIKEIEQHLEQVRLLTLTGPGGAGKTRLSLQVAADRIDRFKQGVWFIELAPLADPSLVPQIVATTLHLHEQPGRTILEVLQDYVRDKNMLLVLDNCEHLIDACAQLADTLLRSAPDLKILASSREALCIGGERTYPVPSLSFPNPDQSSGGETALETLAQFEAVRLFLDRARAVQPGFALTTPNAAAVAEICQRLDGIPLALELAAARVKGLTVEQIASRLDDRFRLLTGGSRTAMARHQTLQATIEWSYALLSEPERLLLQRLSVFAGGWTLDAAEFVCSDDDEPSRNDLRSEPQNLPTPDPRLPTPILHRSEILDWLMRLVDKSLVVVDQQDSAARYRFLDTIREFARDKLIAPAPHSGEAHATRVRNRHLDYFLAFVQEIDQTVRGAEQESGLVALDRELDNLRAALAWSSHCRNLDAELLLASALSRYWRVRSYFSEGRRWLEDALSAGEQSSTMTRAKALMGAGSLANYQADYARARVLLEKSLALHRELNDRQGIAYCLNLLSHGKMMMGDFAEAQAGLKESFAIFRDLNDTRGMGYSLYFLGSTYLASGDLVAARPVLEKSLALMQEAGDKWWIGNTLVQLGWGINRQGEHARALEFFDEALEISTQFGDTRGAARALLYIAEAKFSQGEYQAAHARYIEALKVFHQIGDKWWGTVCLEGLAHIAVHQNDAPRAARLLGAAEHMHELLGAPVLAVYRESNESSASQARAQLRDAAFTQAWNEGRGLPFDAAVQLAMSDPA